jgi:histidyl-tRNA synthetase
VAGGGRYAEGIGWAIGVDRMMLAIQTSQVTSE